MLEYLGLVFAIIFLIELFSLYFFSRLLTRALTRLFYSLTQSRKTTVWLISLLLFPGTVIHELAHVIVAGILLVRSGDIEFMPEIHEEGVKLGSAEIEKTDPFRRALIGFAPVLVGVTIILGSLFYLTSSLSNGDTYPFWAILLYLYILFEISNTMFSSKKDLEGSLAVTVIMLALFISLYYPGILKFEYLNNLFNLPPVISFLQQACLFLLLPIVINTFVYLLVKLLLGKKFQ